MYSSYLGTTATSFRGTDRYRVVAPLGKGAMGVVYRAWDRERQADVALKRLRRVDPERLLLFKNEFRSLADVSHPNLVALYELVGAEGDWLIAMELLSGGDFLHYVRGGAAGATSDSLIPAVAEAADTVASLTETVQTVSSASGHGGSHPVRRSRRVRPPLAEPAQFVRLRTGLVQLASGVRALHAVGTLHRDLKPSNVRVTDDGRVVLLDFGVVAEIGARGHAAQRGLVGTPAYMAPELIDMPEPGPASDWYAVGVILYEALTGRRPFSGELPMILQAKARFEPDRPERFQPDLPPDLCDLCMALLARAPEDRPTGAEVLERLGASAATSPAWTGPRAEARVQLVGRDRHLALLRECLYASEDGTQRTAFVSGTSGDGKTALVGHFLDELSARSDVLILRGRCYERESVPYKALDALVDELSVWLSRLPEETRAELVPNDFGALARLFPVLQRVSDGARDDAQAAAPDLHELRRRAFGALRELLERVAKTRHVVLYIDDAQWGDSDSAALLADVLRPPGAPPALLILSYRSEEADGSAFLRTLLAVHDGVNVAVRRLALPDATELAMTLLRGAGCATDAAERIARESRGSPFFVTELARHVSLTGGGALDVNLQNVLQSRIQGLPETARRLLDAVAVAGIPIGQGIALRAADVTDPTAIHVLRSANLIRTRGSHDSDRMEVYHDRIREAVVRGLPGERLQRQHLALAVQLELDGSGDAETLAAHFDGAGDAERAGAHYVRAAQHAADALAFARAAALYDRAIRLLEPTGTRRRELFEALGDAYTHGGLGRESATAYLEAAEHADDDRALALRTRAAEQLLRSGHVDDGISVMSRVLAAVGLTIPSSNRRAIAALLWNRVKVIARGMRHAADEQRALDANVQTRLDLCWSASAALGMSDHIQGAAFQARHLNEALRRGGIDHVARAYALETVYCSLAGRLQRSEALSTRTNELAARSGQPLNKAWAHGSAGLRHYQFCDWKKTIEEVGRAEDVVRSEIRGAWWELTLTQLFTLWSHYQRGDMNALAELAPRVVREAEDRGDLYCATSASVGLPATYWLVRDQPAEGRRASAAFMDRWSRRGYHLQHYWHLLAEGNADLYEGNGPAAWRRISGDWPELSRATLLRIRMLNIEAHQLRGRSALAAAVTDRARRAKFVRRAMRDAAHIARFRQPYTSAIAALLRAGAFALRQRTEDAAAQLRVAIEESGPADTALLAAVARRRLGRLLGGVEGAGLVAAGDAALTAQRIADIDRMTALFAPGFEE